MSSSQIGAYQTAAYTAAFTQRADSNVQAQRVKALGEAPEFKATMNGMHTRQGTDETSNTNEKRRSGNGGSGAQTAGRGRFVDILA